MPPFSNYGRYRAAEQRPQSESVAAALARERQRIQGTSPLLIGAQNAYGLQLPEGLTPKQQFFGDVAKSLAGALLESGGNAAAQGRYNTFAEQALGAPISSLRGRGQFTDVVAARQAEQDLMQQAANQQRMKAEAERQKFLRQQMAKPKNYKTIIDPENPNQEIQIEQDFDPKTGMPIQRRMGQRPRSTQEQNITIEAAAPQFVDKAVYDALVEGRQAQNVAVSVLSKLESFDEGETFGEAIGRGVAAKWLPQTEAADLKRVITRAAIIANKPNFPGALSDEEREVMQQIAGGNLGVPVGRVKEIWERLYEEAAGKANSAIEIGNMRQEQLSGEELPYKRLPENLPSFDKRDKRNGRSTIGPQGGRRVLPVENEESFLDKYGDGG